MNAVELDVTTSHGRLAVADSGGAGPPVLLIHGNSACKEIFAHQFEAPMARRFRLIAFDLPGHGASDDAIDPQRTYSMSGYADATVELLRHLGIARLAVFGWSLGGHVGIELATRDVDVAGLAIAGTPPIGHDPADFAAGFKPVEHMDLTGKEQFTDADVALYARATAGEPTPPFLEAAVRRTDGRARRLMVAAALAGHGVDQRKVVETSTLPVAVITGANEPFVDNGYLKRLRYRNLWQGKVHVIDDTGHAPFWERPSAFNPLLERFLTDVLG